MISTIKQTPSYLSEESRDYQLLSRLFDSVFNSSKMMIDSLREGPLLQFSTSKSLDLLARTLGFESKHEYNINNLRALCGSFKYIMEYKGTIKAIKDTVGMLLKAQNITESFRVREEPGHVIKIYIPVLVQDVVLLDDIMNYILPAGYVYEMYVGPSQESELQSDITSVDTFVRIEGTSQQFSRIGSYVGSTLITGVSTSVDDSYESGKTYIDEELESAYNQEEEEDNG